MTMSLSRVGTVNVPAVPTQNPVGFVRAGQVPVRVVVRNTSGVPLRLSFEASSLAPIAASVDIFMLPVGTSETFVLAPNQLLYAVALGAGGQLSYASSDALPFSPA